MPSKRVSVKGKGAELFFGESPASMPADLDDNAPTTEASEAPPTTPPPSQSETSTPASSRQPRRRRDTPKASAAAPSTTTPPGPYHSLPPEAVQAIERTLKRSGREVSYVRLSPDEKERLAEISYTYKREGLKVSETDIHRIALNYLLADYELNKHDSVLASTIASLKA